VISRAVKSIAILFPHIPSVLPWLTCRAVKQFRTRKHPWYIKTLIHSSLNVRPSARRPLKNIHYADFDLLTQQLIARIL
jgi:hypothetical protein